MELFYDQQLMRFDDSDRLAIRLSPAHPVNKAPAILGFIIAREESVRRDLDNIQSCGIDGFLPEETDGVEELYLAKLDRLEILKYQVGEVAARIIVRELLESIEGIDEVSLAAEPPTRFN